MNPVRALAAALMLVTTPALAGVVGGPFTATGTLKSVDDLYAEHVSGEDGPTRLEAENLMGAYGEVTRSYTLTFARGKVATLRAESANGEDIDCYVHAPDGKLIVSDKRAGSTCDLRWKVRGSGKVTVSVWNMGRHSTTYTLTTN